MMENRGLIQNHFKTIQEENLQEFLQLTLEEIGRTKQEGSISKFCLVEYSAATENVKAIATKVILQNLTLEQFTEECEWLSKNLVCFFYRSIISKSNDILKYALRKALTDEKLLVAFNYDVKVSVSSSKSQVLNETLFCLHLNTASEDDQIKSYYIEMDINELRLFKKTLARIVNEIHS